MTHALLQHIVQMLEAGDPALMEGAAGPEAVVWHNDDGGEIPAIAAFEGARRLRELVDDLRVEVVRELPIEGGLVAQLELTGTVKASGAELRARNCMFLFEHDGKVQRIEEYVDPTFGAQIGV